MLVDQKHITTVRIHDAKGSDVVVVKEDNEFHLRLSSGNNQVNITLGVADLRKLCQQLVQLDIETNWKAWSEPEFRSFLFGNMRPTHEHAPSWFACVPSEAYETASRR